MNENTPHTHTRPIFEELIIIIVMVALLAKWYGGGGYDDITVALLIS